MTEVRADPERFERTGVAEAVYGPGKTADQCARAVADLLATGDGPVLLTRATPSQVSAVTEQFPAARIEPPLDEGRPDTLHAATWRPSPRRAGTARVVTGGTSDLPVAREAAATLTAYGYEADLIADVGVAGLHRVWEVRDDLAAADVVIVVAGMEAALASVVTGLTTAPVIAVPTSTGYGSSLEGVTALLAMTASCSPGITVVGIDNGFGAGCAAVRMLK